MGLEMPRFSCTFAVCNECLWQQATMVPFTVMETDSQKKTDNYFKTDAT
jgi:hypothetical protein